MLNVEPPLPTLAPDISPDLSQLRKFENFSPGLAVAKINAVETSASSQEVENLLWVQYGKSTKVQPKSYWYTRLVSGRGLVLRINIFSAPLDPSRGAVWHSKGFLRRRVGSLGASIEFGQKEHRAIWNLSALNAGSSIKPPRHRSLLWMLAAIA